MLETVILEVHEEEGAGEVKEASLEVDVVGELVQTMRVSAL